MFYTALSHDKIYIGFTSDLSHRLKSHNELGIKGLTIKFRPWILVYKEEYLLESDAIKREKELKTAAGRGFFEKKLRTVVRAHIRQLADRSSILLFATI